MSCSVNTLSGGGFEKGSVHERVDDKLNRFAEYIRDDGDDDDGKG